MWTFARHTQRGFSPLRQPKPSPTSWPGTARLPSVLEETRRRVEGHWARRFGMPVPGLAPVMVGSTGRHLDNALVLLLGDHAYVDAPPAHLDALAAAVGGLPPAALLDREVWTPWASGAVLGPADHFWADHSTPLGADADPLDAAGRDALGRHVSEHDWREAGFDREVQASFGVVEDGEVVAASVVTPLWAGRWTWASWCGRTRGAGVTAAGSRRRRWPPRWG